MDLMAVLRFVMDHNQQVIGALIVIILATVGLLFARMVGQEKSAPSSGGAASRAASSDLDLGAIESAFKRVLAAQGVTGSASSVASGAAGDTGDGVERDTKIQELAREIDRLTSELASRTDGPGFGGTAIVGAGSAVTSSGAGAGGGADPAVVDELKSKIEELEGKLTEYEIIEDDIADLSRFKEENAELRGELETLKKSVATQPTFAAEVPAAAAPAAVAPVAVAAAASVEPTSVDSEADAILAQLESESKKLEAPASASASASAAPSLDSEADAILAQLSAESAPVAAAAAPVEEREQTLGEQVAALIAEDRAEKAPPVVAPVIAPVNTDANEVAMKEFASSIEVQKAAPIESSSTLNEAIAMAALADGSSILDSSVDTEKLLSEVSTLSETTDDDALNGELDTDKLIAEAGSLADENAPTAPIAAPAVAAATPAVAAPTAEAAAAPKQNPVSQPVFAEAHDAAPAEDDLLAEFKEPTDGGQG